MLMPFCVVPPKEIGAVEDLHEDQGFGSMRLLLSAYRGLQPHHPPEWVACSRPHPVTSSVPVLPLILTYKLLVGSSLTPRQSSTLSQVDIDIEGYALSLSPQHVFPKNLQPSMTIL